MRIDQTSMSPASSRLMPHPPKSPSPLPVERASLTASSQRSNRISSPVPPAERAAPTPPPQPLTLEGLLEAWGQTDSPYDLNSDGLVNVDDLLQFLAQPPEPVKPEAATPPPPASPPASTPATIDSLTNAWGQNDPAHDFNGDGTVNVDDLLALLARQGAQASASESAPPPPPAPPIDPNPPAASPPNSRLQALLNDWGQSGSQYDLNGDGTVNVDDLLQFLAGGHKQSPPLKEADAARENSRLAAKPKQRDHSMRGVQALSKTLLERLETAGFAQQPPSNIREIVQKLELSPKHEQHMLKQIAARYPRGLGVNAIG